VRPVWALSAAAAVFAATIGTRASAPQQSPTQDSKPPAQSAGKMAQDEEAFAILGEQTTDKVCINCHPWDNITHVRRTLREWDLTIANMVTRGAVGTESQFATVKKFLGRYYGIVNVNTAPAEEIAVVLGLSAKDAGAIVEYRKANGKFADVAALGKVSPTVKAKVEEQPDAVMFE
jgi:competence ComEA-like helix-hairpin-helix protein